MTRIVPTIGRKLYFYPEHPGETAKRLDDQPLDATIVYVLPLGPGSTRYFVNLLVIDHNGMAHTRLSIPLVQDEDVNPEGINYCKWMPFQVSQAKVQEAPATIQPLNIDPHDPSSAPAAPAAEIVPQTMAELNPGVTDPAGSGTQEAWGTEFGAAISAVKSGRKVTRTSWPDGVFVYFVPAASYPAQTGIAKAHFGENAMVPYMAYLAIKRLDGQVCMFNPGMDSILADDWKVLPK